MRKICFLLGLLLFAAYLHAESGDSVVVVYNSLVPQSKDIADHYAELRHVPTNQILGLELSRGEAMTRDEFRSQLQKPLLKWLENSHFMNFRLEKAPTNSVVSRYWKVQESKIRYAVLCYGVPVRILPDDNLGEKVNEKIIPGMRNNGAAVDSELFLLPSDDLKLPLSGPLRNSFYGAPANTLNPTNGVLMVARLDGPTPEIARNLVDKAVEAEHEGLWGRAYFDVRGLPSTNAYFIGDRMISKAADLAKAYGFETIVDDKPETFPASFPMSQIGLYVGWYATDACGPFAATDVEFMPGAVAYHLHSFSAAILRSATQHWVGPLLAKGATATMGCVDEPYVEGTPDMAAFLDHFLNGATFGEAAWTAQPVVSWQTTVIGDPLYRPFATPPQELHQRLISEKNKLLEWSHLRVVNLNIVKGFPIADSIAYLQQNAAGGAVLLEKLGDLYLYQEKLESAIHSYQQALKANPTPQQKIRLMLSVADKMTAAGKLAEAYDAYADFLKAYPQYPDKAAVLEQLASLGKKLNKASLDAEAKTQTAK